MSYEFDFGKPRLPGDYPYQGSLLEPSRVLSEQEIYESAFPGGTPVFKATVLAPHVTESRFPWWALLFLLMMLKARGKRRT